MKKKFFSLCTLMAVMLSVFAFFGVQVSGNSNEVILVADNSKNDAAMGKTVQGSGFWYKTLTDAGHYQSMNSNGDVNQKVTFYPKLDAGEYNVYMAHYSDNDAWGGVSWTMGSQSGSVNMGAYNNNAEEYCINLGTMQATGDPEQDSVILNGTGGSGFVYFTALKFVKVNTGEVNRDEVMLVADNSKNDGAYGKTVQGSGFWYKTLTDAGHYQSMNSNGDVNQKVTFYPKLDASEYNVYMAHYSNNDAWGGVSWTMGSQSGSVNMGAYNNNAEEYCINLGTMQATGDPEQDSVILNGTGGSGFVYFTALKFVKVKEVNRDEVTLVADNSKNDAVYGKTEWLAGDWGEWRSDYTSAGHCKSYGTNASEAQFKIAFRPKLNEGEYDVYMAQYSEKDAWGGVNWTMGSQSGSVNMGLYNTNAEEYCINLGTMQATGDPEQDSVILSGTGGEGFGYFTALKFVKLTEESKAKQKFTEDFNACTTANEVYELLGANKELTGIDIDNTELVYTAPIFERLKKESIADFDTLIARISAVINSEKEAPVLSLYDVNENQVTTLQTGTFLFDGSNVNIADGAKVAVAIYGGGKLKTVKCDTYSSEEQMIYFDFTDSAISSSDTVGMFVFETLDILKPVDLY